MISSCVVAAPLDELRTALAQLCAAEGGAASYEATVDGRHIVVIEAPSEADMVGIFGRLRALECVRSCELIFAECEPPELAGFAADGADAAAGGAGGAGGAGAGVGGGAACGVDLAALSDPDAAANYYPSQLLKGL